MFTKYNTYFFKRHLEADKPGTFDNIATGFVWYPSEI